MKKFNSNVSLETQLTEINITAEEIINKNLNLTERTILQKIVFSKMYFILEILFVITMFGMLLSFIMLIVRSSMWKSRLNVILPINQSEVYQQVLETSFSNIKVEEPGTLKPIPYNYLKKYRGNAIPLDARIVGQVFSPLFKLDDSTAIMNIVRWQWRRGKQTYSASRTYTFVENTSNKYNDLDFSIAKRGKISLNKGKDMDNNEFNKKYSFKHSNPVKFRMLFTVASQEKFVNFTKNKKFFALCIDKFGDKLIMSHSKIGSPFEINARKIQSNDEILKQYFIDDLKSDIKAVLISFKTLYAPQGLMVNK